MGSQNINFCPKISQNGGFQPQILHFWSIIFLQKEHFSTFFFDSPKFRGRGQLLLATTPLCADLQ